MLQALQGHPESGKLWEQHINNILKSPQLGFKHTTHDRTIYQAVFKGHKVLLLRQVDDLMIQTDNEAIAKEIFKIIGLKLQLVNETNHPWPILVSLLISMESILSKAKVAS